MKHTNKRLLSILLCLVLMLSLVPAAYADDLTRDDYMALCNAMSALAQKKANEGDTDASNALKEAASTFYITFQLGDLSTDAYNTAKEIYDRYNTSDDGGDGVDLYPAYEARQTLYASLGILGEAHFYKNAITGIRDLVNGTALPAGAKESLKTGAVSKLVEKLNALANADPTAEPYKYGSSYYGLAKKVAPDVVAAYNTVGQAVVGNIAENIAGNSSTSMVGGVMTQVGGIIGSFA